MLKNFEIHAMISYLMVPDLGEQTRLVISQRTLGTEMVFSLRQEVDHSLRVVTELSRLRGTK